MKNIKSRILLKTLVGLVFSLLFICSPIFAFGSDTVNVRVAFYANNQELFSGNVTVNACDESPSNPTKTLNAMCAIDQVALSQNWTIQKTHYDFGTTLDAVNSYTPDFGNNKFWLYYTDKNPGELGLNKYILKDGENLELVYGTNLIKLVSTGNPIPGQNLNLSATYFDMDAWQRKPLSNAVFVINGTEQVSADGNLSINLETNKSYSIYAKKDGYVESNLIKTSIEQNISSAPSGTVNIKKAQTKKEGVFDTKLASEFLKKNILSKDVSSFISDWAGIALSINKEDAESQKISTDLANEKLSEIKMVTDLERKILLKLSAKVLPWGERDLIMELLRHFDGEQFGSENFANDDVFALLILKAVGFDENEREVTKTIEQILSFQESDGSWNGIDMTSASIQALKPFEKNQNVKKSIEKAKEYLRLNQREDGGFGNPFSTAWAIQALITIDENPRNWTMKNKTPFDYLALMQIDDGGISYLNLHQDRVWATAYALPAYLEKTWEEMFKIEEKWPGILDREKIREKYIAEQKEAEKLALEHQEKEKAQKETLRLSSEKNKKITASVIKIEKEKIEQEIEQEKPQDQKEKTGFFNFIGSIFQKIFGK